MPEKVIQLSKNGANPPSVRISIQGKDVVTVTSNDDFCVSSIVQQPGGGESNPFNRPLPWPQQGCCQRVTSGAAKSGSEGTYKFSGRFADGTPYDPIIIIDQ